MATLVAYLSVSHSRYGQQRRQVKLVERMLARRVDVLLMSPRPAQDLSEFVSSLSQSRHRPLVFVDNCLPDFVVPIVRTGSLQRLSSDSSPS